MNGLMLHTGSQTVTLDEVAAVATPKPEGRWFPIPHIDLRNSIVDRLNGVGLDVINESAALYREGARVFGLMEVKSPSDLGGGDFGLVVGWRNSHDKTFPAALTLGSRVFVCDNLAFSGEITLSRKHTSQIVRDLPALVERAVGKLISHRELQDQRIDRYKHFELTPHHASDIILRSIERGVIGPLAITEIVKEWRTPHHPEFSDRTAWSLFNAYTEVWKGIGLVQLSKRTTSLHGLLDVECGVLASVATDDSNAISL